MLVFSLVCVVGKGDAPNLDSILKSVRAKSKITQSINEAVVKDGYLCCVCYMTCTHLAMRGAKCQRQVTRISDAKLYPEAWKRSVPSKPYPTVGWHGTDACVEVRASDMDLELGAYACHYVPGTVVAGVGGQGKVARGYWQGCRVL